MERQMTFEQFQATKTHCDDLGTKLDDARSSIGSCRKGR